MVKDQLIELDLFKSEKEADCGPQLKRGCETRSPFASAMRQSKLTPITSKTPCFELPLLLQTASRK